jgi:D-alanine-D-alanine ligase
LALHGACGEDGRVQAALDLLGVPYTGSGYLGSAIAMDKDLTKRLVQPEGVVTPRWETIRYGREDIPALVQRLELPCVVKPVDSGSSIGVSIAHDRAELEQALTDSLALGGHCVIEQYISGREIQVGILEGKALPSIEIRPKVGFYDYENKYQPGAAEEICPSPISPEWEQRLGQAALTVFRTVGLAVYARADFIVTEDGTPWFLEINTLPGMTPTSLMPQEAAAVGIGYGQLCERIIAASLAARKGE